MAKPTAPVLAPTECDMASAIPKIKILQLHHNFGRNKRGERIFPGWNGVERIEEELAKKGIAIDRRTGRGYIPNDAREHRERRKAAAKLQKINFADLSR